MRVAGFFWVVGALATLLACEEVGPCDRWADYVCDCHDGEEGFDCDELRQIALDPSPAIEDQCAIDLENQTAEDRAAGDTCEAAADG